MTPPRPDASTRAHAALARDAALTRVSHTRRWVILGSAGLSAGFAALVSASPPSHASTTSAKSTAPLAARTTGSANRHATQAPSLPPLADGSQLGLQGPSQNPSHGGGQSAASPGADSQQPAQSAPSDQAAPSPQPGPVSGGS